MQWGLLRYDVLVWCSGDTDASDYKGRDEYEAAGGYDDEDGKGYLPYYGGANSGQYMMDAGKRSDSDTFVWHAWLTLPYYCNYVTVFTKYFNNKYWLIVSDGSLFQIKMGAHPG